MAHASGRLELVQLTGLARICLGSKASGDPYGCQIARLATFSDWPHKGQLSALAFGSAGFHYGGRGDVVACRSCGLTLGRWTADMHPSSVHAKMQNGRCGFIGAASAPGEGAANQAWLDASSPGGGSLGDTAAVLCRAGRCDSILARGSRSAAAVENRLASEIAAVSASKLLYVLTSMSALRPKLLPLADRVSFTAGENDAPCDPAERLKYEACRLGTFSGVWSYAHIVDPQDLARNGFHYTGTADRVQCAFCQGALSNWEAGDRVDEQHARHFTYCRFVQGHDVGNVPIPFSPLESPRSENGRLRSADSTANDAGISSSVPQSLEFAIEARRLATFATWPPLDHLKCEALAKAGFLFIGSENSVRCFDCGGTLSDPAEIEDPWVEHARHFPSCQYLAQVKGREFIRNHNMGQRMDRSSTRSCRFAVDPREIRARVDSAKVRVLLQMNYPLDLLREVIRKRLESVGYDHETSEELLADVFKTHDEMRRPGTQDSVASTGNQFDAGLPVVINPTEPACARRRPEGNHETKIEENLQLKMQLTCKICLDGLIGVVFVPCGHFVCCAFCAPALSACPICRVLISGAVRCIF